MYQADVSNKAKREYAQWLEEKQALITASPIALENTKAKERNIAKAKEDFTFFCKRYFGHLMDSDFAWFHKRAAKHIADHKDTLAVLEWPREHAKSIFADVMMPMFLKARNELTGMMIASANEKKAATLLGDIQAELMFNRQYIADFGEQYSIGNWQDGSFVTSDGIGFWAFGRGQSPRGTRKSEKRPNYCVVDDIDDAAIVKNEARVKDAVDWVLGDLYGAMPNTGSRLIIAGNRIHKASILAHIVGDVEPGDPVKPDIWHLKVFALENPKTHKKDISEKGKPAWKERYSRAQIMTKMRRQSFRLGLREFFHEHIVLGRTFREEHLPWAKLPALSRLPAHAKLVTYCDPSWKGTKKNDFKAVVLMAKNGKYFDIYKAFVRQCTRPEMIRGHYDLANLVPASKTCRHYMEANFMQDTILDEYYEEGERREHMLKIRGDKRKKPDKTDRIEDLDAFTERALIRFNQDEKQNPDMLELRNQFLGFPDMEHDDGPDAVEGAVFKLNRKGGRGSKSPATLKGRYVKNQSRSGF